MQRSVRRAAFRISSSTPLLCALWTSCTTRWLMELVLRIAGVTVPVPLLNRLNVDSIPESRSALCLYGRFSASFLTHWTAAKRTSAFGYSSALRISDRSFGCDIIQSRWFAAPHAMLPRAVRDYVWSEWCRLKQRAWENLTCRSTSSFGDSNDFLNPSRRDAWLEGSNNKAVDDSSVAMFVIADKTCSWMAGSEYESNLQARQISWKKKKEISHEQQKVV